MEPRKAVRRGRVIYVCPECGYQMEMSNTGSGPTADAENDFQDESEEDEDDEDDGEEDKP